MSMAATFHNIFSVDRQRARLNSARLPVDQITDEDDEEQVDGTRSNPEPSSSAAASSQEGVQQVDEELRQNETEDDDEDDDDNVVDTSRIAVVRPRTTMTLAELEEERELARRRSSACVLFAAFVLFRLWVMALQEGDFGLLLLCLVGTSWTVRWIGYNREREEELDRRIANYLEGEPGTTEVDRNDLRMMSFQAQLALAIMESQRQMMMGGYGHPDGADHSPGVSEEARSKWVHFKFKSGMTEASSGKNGDYGSVSQKDKDAPGDEIPHCSICLGEYEQDEDITKLPCGHIYHDECIGSWTESHQKCPLCNFDLESVATSSHPDDSIV